MSTHVSIQNSWNKVEDILFLKSSRLLCFQTMFRNYEINMIDCWIRNWSHIVGGDAFPKSLRLRRFKSDRDKIRQDCSSANYASIVAESDFWYDVTLYFRDGAHNVRWLPASPPSACDVIGSLYAPQFLIHSTFILVFTLEHLPGDCNRIGGSLVATLFRVRSAIEGGI